MSVCMFTALMRDPATGQPIALPVGARKTIIMNFPGTLAQAKVWARANALGTPGVRYVSIELVPNMPEHMILATEIYMGAGAQAGAQQPATSQAHINGGQPTGLPVGNMGAMQPAGERDVSSGFQKLGDADLSGGFDNMFGNSEDGTVSDLVNGGFGSQEVLRQ